MANPGGTCVLCELDGALEILQEIGRTRRISPEMGSSSQMNHAVDASNCGSPVCRACKIWTFRPLCPVEVSSAPRGGYVVVGGRFKCEHGASHESACPCDENSPGHAALNS